MNPTTDPALRSFVPVAPDSHFPIQNLPYGVFRRLKNDFDTPSVGVAIGDQVLDLTALANAKLLPFDSRYFVNSLNTFMALGRTSWGGVRATISQLLRHDEP